MAYGCINCQKKDVEMSEKLFFFAFVQHQMSDDRNLDISGSNSVQFLLNSIGNFDTTLQIGCETKSLG